MIDFRYHVVSIVAVFLALAVGIVLGAGPLKEDLGSTLTAQVTQLRQEKSALRDQLTASEKAVTERDTYADLMAPALAAGKLTDKQVALVVLPGADDGLIKRTTSTLALSGAHVVTVVTLTKDWADPAKATERAAALKPLAALVSVAQPLTDANRLPGLVLSRALYGSKHGEKVGPEAGATGLEVLKGLKEAGLIGIDRQTFSPVTSTLVIAGTLPVDPTERTSRAGLYLELFRSLAGSGGACVLVGGHGKGEDPAVSTPMVATVRADAATSALISTVDDGTLSMGQSTLVLALRGEYDGTTGQFGLASDATAVAPQSQPAP